MLWVSLDRVQQDMTLGAPTALNGDDGNDILEAGTQMTADHIERLRATGVEHVWINDPCGGMQRIFFNPFVTPALDAVTKLIRRVFGNARRGNVPAAMLRDLVDGLDNLERRMFRESGPLHLADRLHTPAQDETEHAANVTYLALGLALRATDLIHVERKNASKTQRDNLSTLAVAAALHDIGKAAASGPPIRANILSAADDDTSYQQHTTIGAQLLSDYRDKLVAKFILHHHLRADGGGFPRAANGKAAADRAAQPTPHVFARIIGLADLFERLREQRPGPHANAFAHAKIMTEYANWFDRPLTDAFQQAVPPYHPGTLFKLSDGSLAAIDNAPADQPMKAHTQTVFSPDGRFIPAGARQCGEICGDDKSQTGSTAAEQTLVRQ